MMDMYSGIDRELLVDIQRVDDNRGKPRKMGVSVCLDNLIARGRDKVEQLERIGHILESLRETAAAIIIALG